ncbi:MAG TPA: universal stress protein [Polyangiaceae bacterium]|nr:universal stress protein [Polyangiaceae bacterium]
MSIVKNVCLATDLSEFSLPALEVAIDVSLARHAGLTLLYVHETGAFELPSGYVENLPSELDRTYDELNRRLAQLERKARSAGVTRVEKRVVQGPIVDEIVRVSSDSDYLVLGTHGRTGLERLVMGSVAQKVMERARCAVVLARPAKQRRE